MNYYKKAIEICTTEQDWKGIVIEIAKLHPKFVVDASKSKSWEVEARKMYIENDDKIAAIKYCRTMTGMSLRDAKEAVERLKLTTMVVRVMSNKNNKEHYKDVKFDTLFSDLEFHSVESFDDDIQVAMHTNLGSITVLDRVTGYGNGLRDIETGFRDTDGKFWLASYGCDVRKSGAKTIGQAINWIKNNANTCVGA